MFKEKTVFVLGAGSSKEVGMPLGTELKANIAKMFLLDQRGEFDKRSDYLSRLAINLEIPYPKHLQQMRRFSDSTETYDSIDDYLARFPNDAEFQFCGKVGIIRSILKFEADCHQRNAIYLNEIWFLSFLKRLVRGVPVEKISDLFENITVINFNYDRCLEFYLVRRLMITYGIDEQAASSLVKKLEMFRPYGAVGSFWQEDDNFIEFGGLCAENNESAKRLAELSSGIRTYSEMEEDTNLYSLIKLAINESSTLVFLGFGFHEQNMEVLRPKDFKKRSYIKNIYASMMGISPNDWSRLKEVLGNFCRDTSTRNNNVFLEEGTCFQLFENNRFGF